MDYIVLDASIALGLCFEDQIDATVLETLEHLRKIPGVVTPQWQTEVAEALLTAERRKRIVHADREHFLNLLRALQIEMDHEGDNDTWGISFALAVEHGIRIQDAQTLLLALRRKALLATCKPEVQRAAKKMGIALVQG
jgi:predicted nucleic acid-binding protein